jgi:hypothetical protein
MCIVPSHRHLNYSVQMMEGHVVYKFNNAPNQWLGIGELHFKNIDARFQSPTYLKIPKFILHYKFNKSPMLSTKSVHSGEHCSNTFQQILQQLTPFSQTPI